MNIILFDSPKYRNQLKPITLTRPIGKIRIGILTIEEKWQIYFKSEPSFLTEEYLAHKYYPKYEEENIYINASFLPNIEFANTIKDLIKNESLWFKGDLIAIKSDKKLAFDFSQNDFVQKQIGTNITSITELPHLFLNNGNQIESDFELLTKSRNSVEIIDKFSSIYSPENIFVEEGANIKACILNAENGPIYIGKNSVIQEGSIVIGPVAICNNSMVAFGSKIRPNTTIGPFSRVGGEVGNTIFQSYSNKAHDGFLGNSYIGKWCNLGANTNNSNLKNDYKSVKLHNYDSNELYDTKEIFCGTFMGDYSKAGISTMFNTGTIVGVSSNVFGSGFQEKFIPSFTWGGKNEGIEKYRFSKAIEVINSTMERKALILSEEDRRILEYISKNQNL
ncbi:glucose-1-phosphate thymidylyltransferase [Lacihabitans sp. LS3-19]|uniref:putative sugar nucleotidyl transferase n=1 Tax=Lacihabitans sp. LS3-19 TaxID=2487335 RepID=UPI0020CE02EF|nr:putative sugar nucleotidyl transferase [Lacihabitans sp. LS3-19]MCP9769028.1 glucose-1-phosphate thymidylyltransferase [Lacihabitans sp. LS3-19]